jgi:hypothetical protein
LISRDSAILSAEWHKSSGSGYPRRLQQSATRLSIQRWLDRNQANYRLPMTRQDHFVPGLGEAHQFGQLPFGVGHGYAHANSLRIG